MGKKTGNKRYKGDSPRHYQRLIDVFWIAIQEKYAAKREREKGERNVYGQILSNREHEPRFRSAVSMLYDFYEYKFQHSDKVDLDKDVKEQLQDDNLDPEDLDFEDLETLFKNIRHLAEVLGHTDFDSDLHQERGIGV